MLYLVLKIFDMIMEYKTYIFWVDKGILVV